MNAGAPLSISVCIPTYAGGARLARAVRSLPRDEYLELIVYDDGSPEAEALEIQRILEGIPRARLQWEPNRGPVAAYRELVRMAIANVVLMLDDDAELPPGFFEVLRHLFTSLPGVGVLSWRSKGDHPGQSHHAIHGYLEPATELAGYCMAFRRTAYEVLGGFDTRFHTYCADSDLALRMTLAGCPSYRVWWPLVLHEEHGVWKDRPELGNRSAIAAQDLASFVAKWGMAGPEMEKRAFAELKEKAR